MRPRGPPHGFSLTNFLRALSEIDSLGHNQHGATTSLVVFAPLYPSRDNSMAGFDEAAEDAAVRHSLSPQAHTDRLTSRKRDFLAGVSWATKYSEASLAWAALAKYGVSIARTHEGEWFVCPIDSVPSDRASEFPKHPTPLEAVLAFMRR